MKKLWGHGEHVRSARGTAPEPRALQRARAANRPDRKKRAFHKPRTIKLFQEAGYIVDDCERRDSFLSIPNKDWTEGSNEPKWRQIPGGKTHDLFGLGDLFAVGHGLAALVQICALSGVSSHKAKARENKYLPTLLRNGVGFLLIGWDKPRNVYVPRLWRVFKSASAFEGDVWFHEFGAEALGRHDTEP